MISAVNDLHCVRVKVQPTPAHPLYYKWQFGLLEVWIYAVSPDDSVSKVQKILTELPYEPMGPFRAVRIPKDAALVLPETSRLSRSRAEELGLGFFLIAAATGIDDTGFDDMCLPCS